MFDYKGTATIEKNYAIGRLSSIAYTSASIATLGSYAYQLNGFGQRSKAILQDGSYWDCQHDTRGQLIDAQKNLLSNNLVLGSVLKAQYDGIGNPTVRQKGGGHTSGNLKSYNYMVNSVNQITSRSLPDQLELLGEASVTDLTVNGSTPSRQGDRYGTEIPLDNSSGASRAELSIVASQGAETVTKATHRKFGAPNITYEVTWYLNYNKTGNKLEVKVIGSHSEFPTFEAIVDDKILYGDKPTAGGPRLSNVGVFLDGFNTKMEELLKYGY